MNGSPHNRPVRKNGESKTARTRFSLFQGILPIDPKNVPLDVLAGVTLASLAIPEVMGYTSIAGMPVVTGVTRGTVSSPKPRERRGRPRRIRSIRAGRRLPGSRSVDSPTTCTTPTPRRSLPRSSTRCRLPIPNSPGCASISRPSPSSSGRTPSSRRRDRSFVPIYGPKAPGRGIRAVDRSRNRPFAGSHG